MLGSVGAASNLDANADIDTEYGPALEADSEIQPTQPAYPPLVIDAPSGYLKVSGTVMGDSDTPDIADLSLIHISEPTRPY